MVQRYQKFIPLIYPQPLLTSDASLRRDSTDRISSSTSFHDSVPILYVFQSSAFNCVSFNFKLSIHFYTRTLARRIIRGA